MIDKSTYNRIRRTSWREGVVDERARIIKLLKGAGMTEIDCPRAKSDMTPCVARDGPIACTSKGLCVGCERHPANLLKELVVKYVELKAKLEGQPEIIGKA